MYVCIFLFQAARPIKSKQTYKQTDEQTDKSKLHLQTTAIYNTQCKMFSEYDHKKKLKTKQKQILKRLKAM